MNARIRGILEYMLEDAEDVVAFAGKVGSLAELRNSSLVQKGIVMSLLNIGELAHHLPKEFTDQYPHIPWRAMVGMRNLAAHGYHIMNLEVIWDTAQVSIPELIGFIKEMLHNFL